MRGGLLSDGKTNDFSLASLHSHTQTQQYADRGASGPNTYETSTYKLPEWTDSQPKTGTYAHSHC